MLSRSRPAQAAPPPQTPRTAIARVLSEVFQPPFTIAVQLIVSPAASPGWPDTWWYGAIAALFTCVLPFGILLALPGPDASPTTTSASAHSARRSSRWQSDACSRDWLSSRSSAPRRRSSR
ncbi:hypothetical protein [Sinomonas flava]|uniref:hypothetical protein n=1 Tax=Sinomonas flava TaxID=496857 RepID=UPI0039A48F02